MFNTKTWVMAQVEVVLILPMFHILFTWCEPLDKLKLNNWMDDMLSHWCPHSALVPMSSITLFNLCNQHRLPVPDQQEPDVWTEKHIKACQYSVTVGKSNIKGVITKVFYNINSFEIFRNKQECIYLIDPRFNLGKTFLAFI